MRTLLILLIPYSIAFGDVVVLKDGKKYDGKVTDAGAQYEVATDGGVLRFDKDRVEKVVQSPEEYTKAAEMHVTEARKLCDKAVEIEDHISFYPIF